MLGFEKVTKEVGVAPDAPSPEWTLKLMSLSALRAPKPEAPAATTPAAPVTAAAPAKTPATPNAAPATAAATPAGRGGRNASPARGQTAGTTANNGRPSLLRGNNNFQRVDVNQAEGGAAAAVADSGMSANEMADLSACADASFTINGTVSRGLDMPQQNDWFGGSGGRPRMEGIGG